MTRTLTIHRTYFLEDEIVDGDYMSAPHTYTETIVYHNHGASHTAHIIEMEGLSFEATGNDWAGDPDGSFTTDYHTGQRCETSAHLDGYPVRVQNAIMAKVG